MVEKQTFFYSKMLIEMPQLICCSPFESTKRIQRNMCVHTLRHAQTYSTREACIHTDKTHSDTHQKRPPVSVCRVPQAASPASGKKIKPFDIHISLQLHALQSNTFHFSFFYLSPSLSARHSNDTT